MIFKKTPLLFLFVLIFASCNKKSKVEKAVDAIAVDLKIVRFDKLFFETKPNDLSKLKTEFPYLFPAGNPDSVWTNKMKNPQWQELYQEVQSKYPNNDSIQGQLTNLFKHIEYYFPEAKTPKVLTVIAEMDINSKGIYADSLALIPLELYLGKNHKYYKSEFPDYVKQSFETNQIAPDLVSSFGIRKIAYPADKSLLSLMLFAGKELYLKDLLLPETTNEVKINYTKSQIDWCLANESYIWSYFIEKNMLYSNDSKLASRFIAPAPFTKFYLEIDNESPGRVGAWMGWQIIKSYMGNNETTLKDLLKMDAKTIFENSSYKPKKV